MPRGKKFTAEQMIGKLREADAAWTACDRAGGPFQRPAPSAPDSGHPAGRLSAAETHLIPGDGASLSVDRAGIEPATHGFSVHCSTN